MSFLSLRGVGGSVSLPRVSLLPLLTLAVVFLGSIAFVGISGDFPLNDDWSFAITTRRLAAAHTWTPVGWASHDVDHQRPLGLADLQGLFLRLRRPSPHDDAGVPTAAFGNLFPGWTSTAREPTSRSRRRWWWRLIPSPMRCPSPS